MRGAMSNRPSAFVRPEKDPSKRMLWETNKKIILATQSICGICGQPVDKTLKYPHPMSPTVDHIIPVSRHGDPTSLDNLQLAHRACNRAKGDKMPVDPKPPKDPNKDLPQSVNWRTF